MCVAIIDRDGAQPANGKLTVTVISGDLENSPADDAEVYVHGHPFRAHLSNTDVEAVVKQVRSGRYEFSLAPGLYDVFVRESGSYPRCKRVQIDAGGKSSGS